MKTPIASSPFRRRNNGGNPIFAILFVPIAIAVCTGIGHAQLTFTHNGQQLNPLAGTGVALADFNNDGHLDAFVVNQDSQDGTGHRVYFGDGRGQFADSGQQLANTGTGKPVVGDINEDGQLDVIAGRTVWFNDGLGQFTVHTNWLEDSVTASDIKLGLADLNGDGHLDVYAALWSGTAGHSRVYINDGHSVFHDSGQRIGQEWMGSLALGDVNGDGFTDAVTAGWKAGGTAYCPNRVWLNDGLGNFHDSGQLLYNGTEHVHGVALGDLNGDGHLDLLLGMNASYRAGLILTNNGTGRFTARQSLGGLWAQAMALGDFDGNGALDAFLGCGMTPPSPSSRVWLNNGSGVFRDSGVLLTNNLTQDAALGDFNEDGKLDVFVVDAYYLPPDWAPHGSPAQVWLNSRSFGPTMTQHPANQVALPGGSVTFSVVTWGDAPLSYQWRFNATNVLSATHSSLVLTNVQLANAGSYSVMVTNLIGAATSNPALLIADTNYIKLNTSAPGRISFECWLGCVFYTQYSSNLLDWFTLAPMTNVTGTLEYIDQDATHHPWRFYRAAISPKPDPARFVWVAPGTFLMGSPNTEQDRNADEGPQTLVTISKGFWMSKYEVMQGRHYSAPTNQLNQVGFRIVLAPGQ